MKIINMYWTGLFFVLGLLSVTIPGNSQNVKLSRQERKEVRKAQMEANFAILDSLLNAKSFILEADFLMDKYGHMVPVVTMLNFIRVHNTNGVIQTGSNSPSMGYNGVGGVTAEGKIGVWKISKDFKRMVYDVHFSILTQLGAYDVNLMVTADNSASATISGTGPDRLTWKGHIATLNNARVFKGQNTI
jgi:hypothetical protein